MFKDFSTGKGGNKINLIQELFNVSYSHALERMIKDYNVYVKENPINRKSIKPVTKWEMWLVVPRDWYKTDAEYWLQYNIGSSMLEKYNVKPIDYYTMTRESEKIKIDSKYMYGYYNNNNEVYKVYQPYNKKHKFHKVMPHVQGLDQLKYDQPYLVICSSLKDAMCLKSFGYNIEVIAPDSENTLIKPHIIENLKVKYKKVITLFDNDEAGKRAIATYKSMYDLDGLCLDKDKDISDSVKNHGIEYVRSILSPLLKKIIHK